MNLNELIAFALKPRWIVAVLAAAGMGYAVAPNLWHHKTAPKLAPAAAAVATPATNASALAPRPGDYHLGEVALTNHCETCVRLSGGKNCTLLPRVDGHGAELTLALAARSADGQMHDLSVTRMSVKDGKPLEIALGDCELSFTPKIEN